MSIKAINWAEQQKLRGHMKTVLMALANHANTAGLVWPTIETLSRKWTGIDRKTAIAKLDGLENLGLIVDTGVRKGKTGRVKVYFLKTDTDDVQLKGDNMSPPKSSHFDAATVPDVGSNDTAFLGKQFQERYSESLTNHHRSFTEPKRGCYARRSGAIGSYNVAHYLDDDDHEQIKMIAPRQDKYWLFDKYNQWIVGQGEIRDHRKAFFGWLRKFIRHN